jgi:hypothetical protein
MRHALTAMNYIVASRIPAQDKNPSEICDEN